MAETEFQWTQDSWDGPTEIKERPVSSRNERLAWFGVIALAVVAFEVTADPASTVSLGCLKFGWDEFRLARWLKRTDPDRRRGKTCSLFYLAWGGCKVILVAFALMFLVVLVQSALEGKLGKGAPPVLPRREFLSAFCVSIFCVLFMAVISTSAVVSGFRNHARIWVGPEVRWARKEQIWPPQAARRRHETSNRARLILLCFLITTLGLGVLIVLVLFGIFAAWRKVSPDVLILWTLAFLAIGAISTPFWLNLLEARMIASSPEECWDDLVDTAPRGASPIP